MIDYDEEDGERVGLVLQSQREDIESRASQVSMDIGDETAAAMLSWGLDSASQVSMNIDDDTAMLGGARSWGVKTVVIEHADAAARFVENSQSGLQLELQEVQWDRKKLDEMAFLARAAEAERHYSREAAEAEEQQPTHDGMQVLAKGYRGTTLAKSSPFYMRIALYVAVLLLLDRVTAAAMHEVGSTTDLGHAFPSSCAVAAALYLVLRAAAQWRPDTLKSVLYFAGPGIEFICTWRPLFYLANLSRLWDVPVASVSTVALILTTRLCWTITVLLLVLLYLWVAQEAAARCYRTRPGYRMQAALPVAGGDRVLPPEYTIWQVVESSFDSDSSRVWCRLTGLWLGISVLTLAPAVLFDHAVNRIVPRSLVIAFQFSSSIVAFIAASFLIPFPIKCALPSTITFAALCAALTWLWTSVIDSNFNEEAREYHRSDISNPGAGDLVGLLLGASVLSLSVELIASHEVIEKHAWPIVVAAILHAGIGTVLASVYTAMFQIPAEYALGSALQMLPVPLSVGAASHLGVNAGLVLAVVTLPGMGAAWGVLRCLPRIEEWLIRDLEASDGWRGTLLGAIFDVHGTTVLARDGQGGAAAVATATWLLAGSLTTGLLMIDAVWNWLVQIAV